MISNPYQTCAADDTFGPIAYGCRDGFDFTLRFENIIFSLTPSAVFITASLYRIFVLSSNPKVVNSGWLEWAKIGTLLVYSLLWLILVVYSTRTPLQSQETAIGAAVIGFLASIVSIPLSWLEHSRSIRSSFLFSIYLFLTLITDGAQARTLLSISSSWIYSRAFTAALCLKAVILLLENCSKDRWGTQEQSSPEPSINIFNMVFYAWLYPLINLGPRKLLATSDLFQLDPSMTSENLGHTFWVSWNSKSTWGGGMRLLASFVASIPWQLFAPVFPRLVKIGFDLSQAFLIEGVGHYLSNPVTDISESNGKALIVATLLIYFGTAASQSLYRYYNQRFVTLLRGCLVEAIYRKTTMLDLSTDDSKSAVTLMSTDVERIQRGARGMHDIWANFIQFAVSTWLLYVQLGLAFLVPIAVVIASFLVTLVIGKIAPRLLGVWVEATERRIGATASLIENMKSIKIMGLSNRVGENIQEMRDIEIKGGSIFRKTVVYSVICSFAPMMLSPVLTFAATAYQVDTTKAYTALSFMRLQAIPLTTLFQIIPELIAAATCFKRVAVYLETKPRPDYRIFVEPNNICAEETNSGGGASPSISDGEVFVIREGSFGWDKDTYSLQNIGLSIPRSKLTMILGPVASGKTTLCKALLSEVPFFKGQVICNSKAATLGFCDQSPFIPNNTIHNVIVGYTKYEEAWYSTVIRAAALEQDITTFEQRDQSMTGPNGSNLSGGQRHRLAIARALYAKPSILIFDDVFSGLDPATEDSIFNEIFGSSGLLRQSDGTAIICVNTMKHLHYADHIIALSEDGRVLEQGSYEKFQKNQDQFHISYIQSYSSASVERSNTEPINTNSESSDAPPDEFSMDDRTRQIGDFTVYKRYLVTLGPALLFLFVLSSILYTFCEQFGTVWVKFWSDYNTSHPRDMSRQAYYLGLYGFIQGFGLICLGVTVTITCIELVKRSGSHFHLQTLQTLMAAPLKLFNNTPPGVLLNRFAQDLNIVDTEIEESLSDFVICLGLSLGMAAVIPVASPYIAISYPFIGVLLYLLQDYYLKTSRQLRYLDLETKSPIFTNFLEVLSGLTTVRAFNWVDSSISSLHIILDLSQRPAYLLASVQNWMSIQLAFIVAIIATTTVSLATQLRSDAGLTGVSLVSLMSFGNLLANTIDNWTKLELGIGAVSRLESFCQVVESEHSDEEAERPPEEWPDSGFINIQNISAAYNTTSNNSQHSDGDENVALRDINLCIPAREKVIVVGRTGSGKSSLLLLLLGLLEPLPNEKQKIIIDDVDLRKVDRNLLRSRIIAIPQDTFALPGAKSYRENLDPFNTASTAQCETILKDVGLWPSIEKQGGLGQQMKSDSLSKGQRQLFSLSRAVLRAWAKEEALKLKMGESEKTWSSPGGVLLLDEVNASVDRETDAVMQRVVAKEFSSYTVIAVTHKVHTLQNFDKMVVMENGMIKEIRMLNESSQESSLGN